VSTQIKEVSRTIVKKTVIYRCDQCGADGIPNNRHPERADANLDPPPFGWITLAKAPEAPDEELSEIAHLCSWSCVRDISIRNVARS
jgi:hypothetical protein